MRYRLLRAARHVEGVGGAGEGGGGERGSEGGGERTSSPPAATAATSGDWLAPFAAVPAACGSPGLPLELVVLRASFRLDAWFGARAARTSRFLANFGAWEVTCRKGWGRGGSQVVGGRGSGSVRGEQGARAAQCVYVFVFVCVCICVYICIYIYIYIYIERERERESERERERNIYRYKDRCVDVCVCVFMCMCVHR